MKIDQNIVAEPKGAPIIKEGAVRYRFNPDKSYWYVEVKNNWWSRWVRCGETGSYYPYNKEVKTFQNLEYARTWARKMNLVRD